jgi:hypothetical protein
MITAIPDGLKQKVENGECAPWRIRWTSSRRCVLMKGYKPSRPEWDSTRGGFAMPRLGFFCVLVLAGSAALAAWGDDQVPSGKNGKAPLERALELHVKGRELLQQGKYSDALPFAEEPWRSGGSCCRPGTSTSPGA